MRDDQAEKLIELMKAIVTGIWFCGFWIWMLFMLTTCNAS